MRDRIARFRKHYRPTSGNLRLRSIARERTGDEILNIGEMAVGLVMIVLGSSAAMYLRNVVIILQERKEDIAWRGFLRVRLLIIWGGSVIAVVGFVLIVAGALSPPR
jgi:hypothetical protein